MAGGDAITLTVAITLEGKPHYCKCLDLEKMCIHNLSMQTQALIVALLPKYSATILSETVILSVSYKPNKM
jgi:hypothetical protein